MGKNLIETVMGAVVLLVAGFFLVFAYSQADLGAVKGYTVSAAFTSVGGLPNGADVRINGIKVGTVLDQTIDPNSFQAVVKMTLRPDIHLPVDSTATIASEGLLGSKFVKLEPGRSGQTIQANGTIVNTKTYKALEDMVAELIFLATDAGPAKSSDTPAAKSPNVEPPLITTMPPAPTGPDMVAPAPVPAPAPQAPAPAVPQAAPSAPAPQAPAASTAPAAPTAPGEVNGK
jgi:phospholipid/cholesterol/gamma-HCH transport system substrate-binding protein